MRRSLAMRRFSQNLVEISKILRVTQLLNLDCRLQFQVFAPQMGRSTLTETFS